MKSAGWCIRAAKAAVALVGVILPLSACAAERGEPQIRRGLPPQSLAEELAPNVPERPEAPGRPLTATPDLLLLLSYDVNFRTCADSAGFDPESPQGFLRVRSCLVSRTAELSCTNRARAGLRKIGNLAQSEPRLSYVSGEVKAVRRMCKGAVANVTASYSPLDAIHISTKNYDQRPRALYRAESFLLFICRSKQNYAEFNLTRIERLVCDATTNRTTNL